MTAKTHIASWWSGYVGMPYAEMGRGRDGVDCWGLVHLAFAECHGVSLADTAGVSAAAGARIAALAQAELSKPVWSRIKEGFETDFDLVIVWRPYRTMAAGWRTGPVHCGLVAGPDHILHADADTDVVRVTYRPPHASLQSQRFEFWRFQDAEALAGVAA